MLRRTGGLCVQILRRRFFSITSLLRALWDCMANRGDYENMSSENVKKNKLVFTIKTLLIYRIKHTLYDMYKINFNVILIIYQMKRIKIKHLILYITRSRCCIFVYIPTSIEIRRKYSTSLIYIVTVALK